MEKSSDANKIQDTNWRTRLTAKLTSVTMLNEKRLNIINYNRFWRSKQQNSVRQLRPFEIVDIKSKIKILHSLFCHLISIVLLIDWIFCWWSSAPWQVRPSRNLCLWIPPADFFSIGHLCLLSSNACCLSRCEQCTYWLWQTSTRKPQQHPLVKFCCCL